MSAIDVERALSKARDPGSIVKELIGGLEGATPKLACVFAPRGRDHAAVAKALKSALPEQTRMLYATSGAPIGASGSDPDAVVLYALSGDLEVGLGWGRELTADPVAAGAGATEQAARGLGTKPLDLDLRTTVGIVIDDGARHKKEELLLGVLDQNPGLSLVGGGAGDGQPPGSTSEAVVGIDGEVAMDAVVLAFIRTRAPWATLRHHAYRPSGEKLMITKVDDSYNLALEINGRPAAKEYADILGVTVDDLEFGKPKGFSSRPTAMRVGREYFLRAAWRPLPDGSILFANRLIENTELELMSIIELVPALKAFLDDELPTRVQNPTGILYFNCYGRYTMAEGMGVQDEVNAAYAAGPRGGGINAVFETFNGFQVNSTLTALAFGRQE